MLYYIKKQLGYGRVLKHEAKQIAHFSISNRKVLSERIFPIFDRYPLLTCKHFSYLRFKEAWRILEDKSFTTDQKNEEIKRLLSCDILKPSDFISPAIAHLNETSSHEEIRSTISASWLVGFTEAKGNFEICPDGEIFCIGYTLVLESDKLLSQLIKRFLHIPSNVNYNSSKNVYALKTKNSRAISNLIDLFSSKGRKFKGIKSLEFKL